MTSKNNPGVYTYVPERAAFSLEAADLHIVKDRAWYEEHDPQSLVDSINEHNAGNPGGGE
jgi:hypothetical protein